MQPWRTAIERHVLWTPRNDAPDAPVPRRLGAFLGRHAAALNRSADRSGTLQRLSDDMFGHKVVWSDLASNLRAAAVPASVRAVTGIDTPIVPLNTVYFIATRHDRDAHILAGYLNSTILRTFARAIAERAKDAHFRFFAWTISVMPLPHSWRDGAAAERIAGISRTAHAAGAIDRRTQTELDTVVAAAYGLSPDHCQSIDAFDAWLRGKRADT